MLALLRHRFLLLKRLVFWKGLKKLPKAIYQISPSPKTLNNLYQLILLQQIITIHLEIAMVIVLLFFREYVDLKDQQNPQIYEFLQLLLQGYIILS